MSLKTLGVMATYEAQWDFVGLNVSMKCPVRSMSVMRVSGIYSENYLLVLCYQHITVLLPWLFYKYNGVQLNLTKPC